jgi:hypothetical protein
MKSFLKPVSVFFVVAILFSSCNNYGDKVSKGHIEVYYKEGISKEIAQRTADLLYETDIAAKNNTKEIKSMQLLKKADTVFFRMVINQQRAAALDDEVFYTLANYLSDSLYNHSPVNVDLTDDKFKTIRILHYKKMNLGE